MKGPITTLMLRNLPQKYTSELLFKEVLDVLSSTVDFDFLYLPWDSRNDCNVGYAFINCCDTAGADRCRSLFTDYFFRRSARRNPCKVYTAHIQGLESNLLHLMGTAVADSNTHLPVIIWQGHKLKLGRVIAALHQLPDPPRRGGNWAPPAMLSEPTKLPSACSQWPSSHGAGQGADRTVPLSTGDVRTTWKTSKEPSVSTNGFASTRVPSSRGSHNEGGAVASMPSMPSITSMTSMASMPSEGASSGAGDANGDNFSRSLAEVSLAERVRALMLEKCTPLPRAASAIVESEKRMMPSPADLFGDGNDTSTVALGNHRKKGSGGPAQPQQPPRRSAFDNLAAGSARAEQAPRSVPNEPRVIELSRDPTTRVFDRFFEKCAADPPQGAAPHASFLSLGQRQGGSNLNVWSM